MRKGFLHALEIVPVFIIWMIILAGIWHRTGFLLENHANEWKIEKLRARGVAWSEILVHEHGKTPWEGCAVFSEEKRRVMEYQVEHDCLARLDQNAPNEITRIGFRGTQTLFSLLERDANENAQCVGAQTPIILIPENELGFLDVVACE